MGQIQKSHTQVGKPTSTHTGWKMAHEASDFLDRIWEPQHITSYTEMNNVTVQKLNQTGALPVTDMKEHFCSPWPAQDSMYSTVL